MSAVCARCGAVKAPDIRNNKFCTPCSREYFEANRVRRREFLATGDRARSTQLYQEGFGVYSIGRALKIPKPTIRKWLIEAGVYNPDPKHNGTAKRGTGPDSRILANQRRREARSKCAAIIRGLRKGIAVERTCKDREWPANTLWNWLYKTKGYKRFIAIRDIKAKRGRFIDEHRKHKWHSRQFKDEEAFCDAVEAVLVRSGVVFIREARLSKTRDRVDFQVGNTFIECKNTVKTGCFSRAIGQCAIYKFFEGRTVKLVIPDDVIPRRDQEETLKHLGIELLRLTQFSAQMDGELPLIALMTRNPTALVYACKCCGKTGEPMSLSPSGATRSYCKWCEPRVLNREVYWHQEEDRWIAHAPNVAVT